MLYVLGNHEAYGRDLEETYQACRDAARDTANVQVVERGVATIAGVRFLGATLWTDLEITGDREVGAGRVAEGLNDYRLIRYQGRRLQPADTRVLHLGSRSWLAERLAEGPAVVVTHHGPHMDTQPPQFRPPDGDTRLAPGFVSDCGELFGVNAPLWICGHTHHCCDFEVAGTRIVSNQAGYPHESVQGFAPDRLIDLDLGGM
ncbi:metallophosphoesterase [Thiohalorhabdus methylotrophus]|uniref:Metallophosphoesterase n=1 Tax=Thiohalorhabdus methylotrophus TaxID=3242694 RepID=A0ABV4TZS4_9GAMM